jgi:hypothetical protein
MSEKNKRKIKNFLIIPEQQLKHAALIFSSVIVGMGFVGIFLLLQIRKMGLEGSLCADNPLLLEQTRDELTLFFILAFLGFGLFYGIASIIYTHRVFGSVYAMEAYLKTVLKGEEPNPLNSRKNDQLRNLVDLVREAGEKIKSQKK